MVYKHTRKQNSYTYTRRKYFRTKKKLCFWEGEKVLLYILQVGLESVIYLPQQHESELGLLACIITPSFYQPFSSVDSKLYIVILYFRRCINSDFNYWKFWPCDVYSVVTYLWRSIFWRCIFMTMCPSFLSAVVIKTLWPKVTCGGKALFGLYFQVTLIEPSQGRNPGVRTLKKCFLPLWG